MATLDNFGKMGEQPTNQALLDWLAVEFVNRGWSIKQINRLMMTSEAYQMASSFENAADTANDPDNRYLWRYRMQRLEGEIVRDSIMAVGGIIDLAMGGPADLSVRPEDILVGQFRGNGRTRRRAGCVAAERLRLSAAIAAVSDVRHVRSCRT